MNRMPSAPLSAWPVVSGMSDAVIPIRSTPAATAAWDAMAASTNAARPMNLMITRMDATLAVATPADRLASSGGDAVRRIALLDPDRGQVLEPVLRLHEALDLGRQRVRVGVVHHPDQDRVVHDRLVRLRQQLVLPGRIEGLLRIVDEGVDFRVRIPAPVDTDRRDLAGMEETNDGVERIGGDIGDVVRRDAGHRLVLGALAPIGVERLEFHHLEVDIDADLLEALLQELVHRQRQHLPGAALGDHKGGLERLLGRIAGLLDETLRLGGIVFDLEGWMAEPRARRIELADRGL